MQIFASIAVGKGLGKAYYRAPYEGGAAFLIITDGQLRFECEDALQRIVTVFPQAISALGLPDHRQALRCYVEHYGFNPEPDGEALILRQQEQELLRAEFDEHRRLRNFKGRLQNTKPIAS